MIRNIIFDIGNVLTDFRWEGFLRDKGFDDNMIRRIAKATVAGPDWIEVDRGVWSVEKLLQAFIELDPEISNEIRAAFENIHGMVTPRAYAIPWINELKGKGYRTYYLSNFSYKAYVECSDALGFLLHMDGGILSYQEKVIKPDPGIYRLLLERYGLKAQECVFLDDTAVNVEAARAEGIAGIVFKTREQAQEELASLGVL